MQKPIEWVIATKLERLYSKEEILTMYLNQFDFLYNAVGIKSAAQVYFNTTPTDLKIEESAMLVGMCKNPAYFNPIRHPERTMARRNTVLGQMCKYEYITKEERDSLSALPLDIRYHSVDHKQGLAPYFREYLRVAMTASEPSAGNSLARWRWENDPLYGFCEKYRKPDGNKYNIYRDGLKIYTTIDSRMQRYAEEAVHEHMTALQKEFDKELKKKKNAPYSTLSLQQKKAGGSFDMNKVMMSHMTHSDRYLLMDSLGIPHDSIIKTFH
jgi:penicillin-binding protein 1A